MRRSYAAQNVRVLDSILFSPLDAVRIVESLLRGESETTICFVTESRADYDLLCLAAGEGWLPGELTLGRSGPWLNRKRVQPPSYCPGPRVL